MLLVISALVLQAGQKAFSKGWALLDAWNYLQGNDSGRGNVGIGLLVTWTPHSMVINNDQKHLKYVSVGKFTLAQKGSSSVTVEGVNDKRYIIGAFGISFTGNFQFMLGKLLRVYHVFSFFKGELHSNYIFFISP